MDEDSLTAKLLEIQQYAVARLESLGIDVPDLVRNVHVVANENFWNDCIDLLSYVEVVDDEYLNKFDTLIFEGAQGLLLSEAHGVMPHLTPSDPGCTNVMDICNKLGVNDVSLCYITRVYTTRHGAGPLHQESNWESLGIFSDAIANETNITNEFQGSFRYSYLDVESVSSAITGDITNASKFGIIPKIELSTTCVDQIKAMEFVVSYLPALNDLIDRVKPSSIS